MYFSSNAATILCKPYNIRRSMFHNEVTEAVGVGIAQSVETAHGLAGSGFEPQPRARYFLLSTSVQRGPVAQ